MHEGTFDLALTAPALPPCTNWRPKGVAFSTRQVAPTKNSVFAERTELKIRLLTIWDLLETRSKLRMRSTRTLLQLFKALLHCNSLPHINNSKVVPVSRKEDFWRGFEIKKSILSLSLSAPKPRICRALKEHQP